MLWRDVCRLDRFIDSHGVQVYNVISFQTSLPQLKVKAYNRSSRVSSEWKRPLRSTQQVFRGFMNKQRRMIVWGDGGW